MATAAVSKTVERKPWGFDSLTLRVMGTVFNHGDTETRRLGGREAGRMVAEDVGGKGAGIFRGSTIGSAAPC